jgi:amino acid transporter
VPGTRAAMKRAVLGRPRHSRQLRHQLLPKWMALPVFTSDPLSSVAYATQEMLFVLVLAGAGAFRLVGPLAVAVVLLLAIVVTSYRQTVRAYPHGGGAYIVARQNLGEAPGLLAAGALLIDYVLTVSVSIAAGVAAIVAALPDVAQHRVVLALGLLAVVAVANLRGVREAGALFAVPTYGFVASILALVATGLVRCAVQGCPAAPTAGLDVPAVQGVTLFLVLRAFASGSTALTGVEAISNGVTAFRRPQSRNAATTLAIMGVLSGSMFLGISFLARATGVVVVEGGELTVVAQIAQAVFGHGPLFYLVQIMTMAILVLAANTAFADFPRLASVLARDRYVPRQFVARGDRLVFSNGIVALTATAATLLIVYQASVTRLIQLYVVGVFTSFTLSQAGMVRHWLRLREPGWERSAVVNGVGAVTTGVVLVVVAVTKFTGGAWIVLVGVPLVAAALRKVHRHYAEVSLELRSGVVEPEPLRPNHMVILLDRVDEAAARALSYARTVSPASVTALGVPLPGADLERRWRDLTPDVPLRVLQPAEAPHTARVLRDALVGECDRHGTEAFTTALVPETLSRNWLQQLREHRLALRLKSLLLGDGRIVVTDLTSPPGGPGPYTVEEPAEHHVVVMVAGVHRATLRAITYAQGLQATSLRAMTVNLDTERTGAMLEQWEDWGIDVPLELVDSPFRSLSSTVRGYVREFAPDGRRTVVSCVLPEFVVARWWQASLHNQSALAVKATLLFQRGVVVTSVPYRLRGPTADAELSTEAWRP